MSATIKIYRWTGSTGSPTKTDITSTNTRVNAVDSPYTTETTYPIAIPASGTNYSYWCATRLHCSVAPTTLVNNIRWYTDGSNGFGTGISCNCNTATSYVQATGTAGVSGDVLNTSNYSTLAGSTSSAFTYTSGSPLSVSGSTSSTGDFGDFVVFQYAIGTTASAGASAQEVFTWAYDES